MNLINCTRTLSEPRLRSLRCKNEGATLLFESPGDLRSRSKRVSFMYVVLQRLFREKDSKALQIREFVEVERKKKIKFKKFLSIKTKFI